MSGRAVGWALRHSRSEDAARLVLVAIADECRDDGTTWVHGVKIATLAVRVRKTARTVKRAIAWLEEAGELIVDRHRGRGVASRYALPLYRTHEDVGPPDPFAVTSVSPKDPSKVAPTTPYRGDAHVISDRACGDTGDQPVVTPASPSIDIPSTTPSTATEPAAPGASAPETTLPAHDPEEETMAATTSQQQTIGRVLAAIDYAGRQGLKIQHPPTGGEIAGMLRNLGGLQEVETLVAIVRKGIRTGALADGKDWLFGEVKAHRSSQTRSAAGAKPPRASGRGGGPRPAGYDETRRMALDDIAEEARHAAAGR